MNDDLSPVKGILTGLAISIPIWVLIIWVGFKIYQ